MISVRHLSKEYVQPDGSVLKVMTDVNCDISRGEVISIIGPSGTGKSTFLRILNQLEKPTGGEILFNGENILAKGYPLNKLRQKMGMVFQNFNLFSHLSVLENVIHAPMHLAGLSRDEAQAEAMQLLHKVGMSEKAYAMPSDLSGGQKQRVAIARSLAMHPDVILFDEPTSALDPTMVGEVESVMRQLATEGLTMLIVTHEMRFAQNISTRIFFMNKGVIYEDGTPQQVFENPVHSDTKAFVQRIRKLSFSINGPGFDFLDMHTQIARFCIKYNIAAKQQVADRITDIMVNDVLADYRPLTVRLTFSELSNVAALDFMIENLRESPLNSSGSANAALVEVKQLGKELIEEPTTRGHRIKVIL